MITSACTYPAKQRSGALHLTQKVDYGVILLTALSKPRQSTAGSQRPKPRRSAVQSARQKNSEKDCLSIKKIAEESNISFLFLQKIAGLLQKAGIIKAERGKFGGYSLTRELKEVNLGEVIEALEGPIAIVPCLNRLNTNICKRISYCSVRPSMTKINEEIKRIITTKTLDYFITSGQSEL